MAKRFTFRLDPVLALRKRREDEQKRVVAERLRQLQRSCDELNDLFGRGADTLAWARQRRQEHRLNVVTTLQEQRWRLHLGRRIAWTRQQIKIIESELHQDRGELAQRCRARKAIEKLRERRLAAHRTAQDREERVQNDEIASQKYIRARQRAADVMRIGG